MSGASPASGAGVGSGSGPLAAPEGTAPAYDRATARKAVVAASMGNALEWFDIIVYAFMAPVIQKLFFPDLGDVVGLIVTFALVGVSYLIRPLGALVLGAYGDRRGRKAALTLTIALMTLGVAIMGFAPTAATIGAAAPLVIVVSRLVQGFSAGGEFGSATAYMTEHAADRKAYSASYQIATQGVAMFLAGAFGFVLNIAVEPATLHAWAWRVPFWFGLLIGPVGWWIRSRMADTPEFLVSEQVHSPVGTTFAHHFGRVLTGAACVGMATMSVYLITYLPAFAQKNLGLPAWSGYAGAAVAGAITAVVSPFVGHLADRLGQTRIMLTAAVVGLIVAVPLFAFVTNAPNVASLIGAEIVVGLLMAFYFAPLPSLLSAMFPVHIRTTGMSLAYNIGVTLLGGFAGSILTWLVATYGLIAPSYYYIAVALLSVAGLVIARRAYGQR